MYIIGGGVPNPLAVPIEVHAFHFESQTWTRLTCRPDPKVARGDAVPVGM